MSYIVEDLKVGKLSSHKYVDNVETEPDKRNLVDISDEKESIERDEISKNDHVRFTDSGEEYEEIDKIN